MKTNKLKKKHGNDGTAKLKIETNCNDKQSDPVDTSEHESSAACSNIVKLSDSSANKLRFTVDNELENGVKLKKGKKKRKKFVEANVGHKPINSADTENIKLDVKINDAELVTYTQNNENKVKKTKKKKSRNKVDSATTNRTTTTSSTENADVGEKKTSSGMGKESAMIVSDVKLKDNCLSKGKRKKKKHKKSIDKNCSSISTSDDCVEISDNTGIQNIPVDNEISMGVSPKKKKSKKKVKNEHDVPNNTPANGEIAIKTQVKNKKTGKKKLKETFEDNQNDFSTNTLVDSEIVIESPLKTKKSMKKKFKKKLSVISNSITDETLDSCNGTHPDGSNSNTTRNTGDRKRKIDVTIGDNQTDGPPSSKKKRKKLTGIALTVQDSLSVELDTKPKKKKKTKNKSDASENNVTAEDCKLQKEDEENKTIHSVVKKKIRKTEKVLSEENGTSAQTAGVNQKMTNDAKLGQWKTAKLSSSAQQDKFVRLLGGTKSTSDISSTSSNGQSVLSRLSGVWKPQGKKLWGSLQNSSKKTFSTMALNEKESEKLATNLESQFNQTLSFNLQKRKEGNAAKGLGFQEDPAKGKKHYIDVHKVKSVALD